MAVSAFRGPRVEWETDDVESHVCFVTLTDVINLIARPIPPVNFHQHRPRQELSQGNGWVPWKLLCLLCLVSYD